MLEEARYTYTDEHGLPVYEVVIVRMDELKANGKRKKHSYLERIFPDGSRLTGQGCMDGVARVPYRLPELLAGIVAGRTIFFVEGEKCADSLMALGLCATTRSEGSNASITEGNAASFLDWFRGVKEIVVLPDCDVPGRQAAVSRARTFSEILRVRLVDLGGSKQDGYDVADWLAEGHTVSDLRVLVNATPYYDPPKIESIPSNSPQKDVPHVDMARIFTLTDLLQSAVTQTERAVEDGPRTQRTPFKQLNLTLGGGKMEGGFSPGELVITAGPPGGGKTALVWGMADYTSAHEKGLVLVVSGELGEIDAVRRFIAQYTGITMMQQRMGHLSAEEWHKLNGCIPVIGGRRLAIIGQDGTNLAALEKSIDHLASQTPLAAIVFDHTGVIRLPSETRTRSEALEASILKLQQFGRTYDCVMHVIMPLNREGYKPDQRGIVRRPCKSDLRDGGAAESHANFIIMPYRPFPKGGPEKRQQAELIVEKSRDGWEGSLPMRYIGERYLWLGQEDDRAWFEGGDT
jgi:hypothetical protein